jgi:glucose/mannose-6-phosphate isomerase
MSDGFDHDALLTAVAELDTEDMLGHLRNFPDDLAAQWSVDEPQRETPPHLFCLGMGGSAAAGDFLASLAERNGNVGVTALRDYNLPNWRDEDSLYIATSYSGNTEETLSSAELALARGGGPGGANCITISSGGKLAEMGDNVTVPGGQPPRSAFGHLFGALTRIAASAGVVDSLDGWQEDGTIEGVRNAVAEFDFVNNPDSPALAIARTLLGKEIGIVSAHELGCAGTRFANQLNENGGIFARATTLPEMNHNEIIAWTDPAAKESQAMVLLTWDGMHERVAERIGWMTESVEVDIAWKLHCEGESLLQSMLYACVAMDWISCAVAILRGKDPSAIGAIRDLKEHLDQ